MSSLLLLGVGISQMTNNIAYGMPARIGLDIPAATAIMGAICLIQVTGLLHSEHTPTESLDTC